MKKYLAVIIAAFSVLGIMGGCKSTQTSNSETSGTAVNTTPITACVGSEPASIDPAINQTVDGATYIVHLFEGLERVNNKNQIVPGIAKSAPNISSDGLTYTYTLRDAEWSDGKPVTAGDFVYAWQRDVNPKTASQYAYQLYYIKNAQEINAQALDASGNPEKVKFGADGNPVLDAKGNSIADPNGKYISAKADGSAIWLDDLGIKATDNNTVVVTLAAPCAYFDQIAAFPTLYPVRKDIVEANPNTWATDPKTIIGDGPFVVSSWTHSSQIVMKKSSTYWDKANVVPTEIDWLLMDNADSILSAYKNGRLDLADTVPPDEIPSLVKSGDCKIFGNLGTYYFDLNTKKAPFNDVKVREALSLAFDRQYLVNSVSKGGQLAAGAFVPTGVPDATAGSDFRKIGGNFYDPTTAAYKANVKKAQGLLTQAGFPGGKGFPTVELKYNTNPLHKAIAEYMQSEWKTNLGINITLVNEDFSVLVTDRNKKNYQIARDGWLGDYSDAMTFIDMFTSTSGNNNTGWSDSKYDSLTKDALTNTNEAKRMTDMHSAEKILMNNWVVIPVFYYTDPMLVSKNIQGFVQSALGFKYLMWTSVK